MTAHDAILIRIFAVWGWTVKKSYTEIDRWHFRLYRPENEDDAILGFTIEQLFESWLDRDDVLEQVMNVSINRRDSDASKDPETTKRKVSGPNT